MKDRASTPLEQSHLAAPTSAPATPGPSSAAPSIEPMTPGRAGTRLPPPSTPGDSPNPLATPARTRTPRIPSASTTPGGSSVLTGCTVDKALFSIVTVHTAKCTECDKRNMSTMRRCPGCTFQICSPCYERREKKNRGLDHGMAMSGSPTPTAQRVVRNKPVASTPGKCKTESAEKTTDGESGDLGSELGSAKGKERATMNDTPVEKSSGKKRALKKRPRVLDSGDDGSSDAFEPNDTSPTPSKRQRTAVNPSGIRSSAPPGTRAVRKRPSPAHASTYTAPSPGPSGNSIDPPASRGIRLGDMDVNALMQTFGVNTPENPYEEHLLGRREPVVSNPVIMIPEIVKRGFKPRISAAQIQKNIQEKVLKKMQVKAALQLKEKSAEQSEVQDETKSDSAKPLTVRTFVAAKAAEHRNDVAMDEDENRALWSTIELDAYTWSRQIYNKLLPENQEMVVRGLNMRLDLIDGAYTAELTALLDAAAVRKLQEFAQDSAPSAV